MAEWTAAMRSGRYEEAWSLAEQSLAERDPARRDDPRLPYHQRWVWDGRAFEDRDVLVRCYHGLGDTIQYARFLPLLGDRAKAVTVEVPPRLADLIATVDHRVSVVPFDAAQPLPPRDVDVEITELDFALRATPHDARAPYLAATKALLPKGTIGLCYAAGDWEPRRSVPPALLASICRDYRCLSLVSEPTDLPVLNPHGCPFDIGATAAFVAGADLVITVDTMIAHLAGALGRPVWLLLRSDPDWRWAPEQAASPWYPTMRLYVQPSPGDWAGVIERVERDLAETRIRERQA